MADAPHARHLECTACSSLRNYEQAVQYVQSEEPDGELPAAVGNLRSLPTIPRGPELMRCPECGTWYLYESAYEFLIGFGGSYDEQTVTRLYDQEAIDYLEGRTDPVRHPEASQPAPPDEDTTVKAVMRYMIRMAEAYFARGGRAFSWEREPTTSWFLFGLYLDDALIPHADVLSDNDYLAWLRKLFEDLFDFLMVAYAGNPTQEIAEMHRAFGSGMHCGPILPLLLPERARPVMAEVDRILEAYYDDERNRQDQMGY